MNVEWPDHISMACWYVGMSPIWCCVTHIVHIADANLISISIWFLECFCIGIVMRMHVFVIILLMSKKNVLCGTTTSTSKHNNVVFLWIWVQCACVQMNCFNSFFVHFESSGVFDEKIMFPFTLMSDRIVHSVAKAAHIKYMKCFTHRLSDSIYSNSFNDKIRS